MTPAMLVPGALVALLLIVLVWAIRRIRQGKQTRLDYEEANLAAINLHRIRKRLEVAKARAELRADVTDLREELEDDLDDFWRS